MIISKNMIQYLLGSISCSKDFVKFSTFRIISGWLVSFHCKACSRFFCVCFACYDGTVHELVGFAQ